MSTLIAAGLACAGGYCVGGLPIAWLLVRRRHGVDLRAEPLGTGALGALRIGGVRTAVWSVVLEALKGGFVGLSVRVLGGPTWIAALAIAGCVLGDAFPPTFRRGGRGVVPLVSGLLVALPLAGLITGIVAILAVAFSRNSGTTVNSVVATAVPVGLVVGTDSWLALIAAGVIVATLIVRRGRSSPARISRPRVVVIDPPR